MKAVKINGEVLEQLKTVVAEHDEQAVDYARKDNIAMAHFALGCSVGAQEIIDVLADILNDGDCEEECKCCDGHKDDSSEKSGNKETPSELEKELIDAFKELEDLLDNLGSCKVVIECAEKTDE